MSKRAIADITELKKQLYVDSGIYYEGDDSNILKGHGCVFGPSDTPYEDCPMLYEFDIPGTYPFDPPKVEFKTYDGITRFHPNMYVAGKCCLSILHTWDGPKWASTLRLSTVLVTLQSLMDNDPIKHEPGYANPTPEMAVGYRDFIEISCIRYILERAEFIVNKKVQPRAFEPFVETFKSRLPKTLARLKCRLENLLAKGEKTFVNLPYSLSGKSDYEGILRRTVKCQSDFMTLDP